MLIDTHCHIAFPEYDADREAVIQRALDAGVGEMVIVGTDFSSSQQAIALAERYPFLHAAVGLHPHEADSMNQILLDQFAALSEHPKVVAIGETGLDFYYNHASQEKQQEAFLLQIALAQKRRLPLVIHSREAWDETFAILETVDPAYLCEVGAVLHCFTGDKAIVERATAMGLFLSFSGIVTFAKATTIQEAATAVDARFLLIETDAPFLAPQGYRGKSNEPAYIATTAEKIATLRHCATQEVADQTTANARRIFRI